MVKKRNSEPLKAAKYFFLYEGGDYFFFVLLHYNKRNPI